MTLVAYPRAVRTSTKSSIHWPSGPNVDPLAQRSRPDLLTDSWANGELFRHGLLLGPRDGDPHKTTRTIRVLCQARRDADTRHARVKRSPLTVTCHNTTLVIPDWTEPLPRRSAMGVALSADGAPGRPTGRCMEVAGRRRSARMTGKAVPQPSGGVGDATLPCGRRRASPLAVHARSGGTRQHGDRTAAVHHRGSSAAPPPTRVSGASPRRLPAAVCILPVPARGAAGRRSYRARRR